MKRIIKESVPEKSSKVFGVLSSTVDYIKFILIDMTWDSAKIYAKHLKNIDVEEANISINKWRLPTPDEMIKIFKNYKKNKDLYDEEFGNYIYRGYWTSEEIDRDNAVFTEIGYEYKLSKDLGRYVAVVPAENYMSELKNNSNGEHTMKESKTKRTIKEYVEPKAFEDKALFDDFKDSIGGRCFNKDSVYRWVYKLTDIKPTDDEIYEIMDKWVKNKWAYKKENEKTGANFYYFDLKETVSESKKIMKEETNKQITFDSILKVFGKDKIRKALEDYFYEDGASEKTKPYLFYWKKEELVNDGRDFALTFRPTIYLPRCQYGYSDYWDCIKYAFYFVKAEMDKYGDLTSFTFKYVPFFNFKNKAEGLMDDEGYCTFFVKDGEIKSVEYSYGG